ncbi:hypothetical protein B0H14DRAFT_2166575, partial [Mycena olivaceomarginata]
YIIAAHDVSPEKKSADNLLAIVLAGIDYCEKEFGIIFVGYCTDDGGDAMGMRTRLEQRIPKFLVTSCWGHQVMNMNEVPVSSGSKFHAWSQSTTAPLWPKWFTNHSRAIGLLKDQEKLMERFKATHRILTLIFPVVSRWIYHFLAVRRLFTLFSAMRTLYLQDYDTLIQCAGAKRDAKEKAKAVLAPIEDPQFCSLTKFSRVKIILEPLAIAAKCMQVPDAGLDQVLLMLGNLYRIYGSTAIDSRRETFILTLFLSPYTRATAFSTRNPAVKPIALFNNAKELFTRFFDIQPDLDFHSAFLDCSKDAKEFSGKYMGL